MSISERVLVEIERARTNVPATLKALKRFHGLSDVEISSTTGIPRSTVRSRFAGVNECTPSDLAAFAAVLGVPIPVLYLHPDDALRWVLDHRSDVEEARVRSRCCSAAA